MSNPLDSEAGAEQFDNYEAELKLVEADLTQKLDQIDELSGEERKSAVRGAERAIEEAKELVQTPSLPFAATQTPPHQPLLAFTPIILTPPLPARANEHLQIIPPHHTPHKTQLPLPQPLHRPRHLHPPPKIPHPTILHH